MQTCAKPTNCFLWLCSIFCSTLFRLLYCVRVHDKKMWDQPTYKCGLSTSRSFATVSFGSSCRDLTNKFIVVTLQSFFFQIDILFFFLPCWTSKQNAGWIYVSFSHLTYVLITLNSLYSDFLTTSDNFVLMELFTYTRKYNRKT